MSDVLGVSVDPEPTAAWIELAPDLIRRVLMTTQFEYCDTLFWRNDNGVLSLHAVCSDFFMWGCADLEAIESEADVEMLEAALADLRVAAKDMFPLWVCELYAARRRHAMAAPFMFNGKYAMDESVHRLFLDAAIDPQEQP